MMLSLHATHSEAGLRAHNEQDGCGGDNDGELVKSCCDRSDVDRVSGAKLTSLLLRGRSIEVVRSCDRRAAWRRGGFRRVAGSEEV